MKNVLVFGTGSIAQKHIKNLFLLNFKVYVYSEENKLFFKNNNNIIRVKNLKNLPEFYFAVIANKTNKHLKIIKFLIKNKINIYCEKPIYFKKFDYKKIRQKIIKNKLIFSSGYQLLNDTKVLYIKKN